ncbi:CST, telomere maintenance, complex subunit CTC1-domain-containing protein [Zopfochytrium polystomum]|nr:CST, telomere maintenance, complex subunit CTC1-domain-containing protein [Zopfochytrium polystomum]
MHFRVVRVAELIAEATTSIPSPVKEASLSGPSSASLPSLRRLLVGGLVSVAPNDLEPPSVLCFADGTGIIPIELTTLEPMSWMPRKDSGSPARFCIVDWSLVPHQPSESTDSKFPPFHIEAAGPLWRIPRNHQLNTLTTYEFSSDFCDPVVEATNYIHNLEKTLTKRTVALIQKYCPVSLPFYKRNWMEESNDAVSRLRELCKLKALNMHGRVRAKSGLVLAGGVGSASGQAFFVVELEYPSFPFNITLSDHIMAAFILYRSKPSQKKPLEGLAEPNFLALYHSLHVDQYYLFVDIQTQLIKDEDGNETKLLLFSMERSRLYSLSEEGIEQIAEWAEENPQEALPVIDVELHSSANSSSTSPQPLRESLEERIYKSVVISYVGRVTRVLDGSAGEYELDHKHQVQLTYYPRASRPRLRVGARVKLHNVHLLFMDQLQLNYAKRRREYSEMSQPDEENPANSPRALLIACLYSSIEIIEFPETLCDPFFPPPANNQNSMWQDREGFNAADFQLLKELAAEIERNSEAQPRNHTAEVSAEESGVWTSPIRTLSIWAMQSAVSIMNQLGFLPYETFQMNMISAIRHSKKCTIADTRLLKFSVLRCADLDQICRKAIQPSLASTRTRPQSDHFIKVFQRHELHVERTILLGRLGGNQNSQITLSDCSGECIVALERNSACSSDTDRNSPFCLNDFMDRSLCAIMSYDIVCEVFKDIQERQICFFYVRCCEDDIALLRASEETVAPKRAEKKWVMLVYLEHIVPATMRSTENNSIKLVGGFEGKAWKVDSLKVPFMKSKSYSLLSDHYHTVGEFTNVHLLPHLSIGCFYLLYNVDCRFFENVDEASECFCSFQPDSVIRKVAPFSGDIFDSSLNRGPQEIHVSPGRFSIGWDAVMAAQSCDSIFRVADLETEHSKALIGAVDAKISPQSLVSFEGVVVGKSLREANNAWLLEDGLDGAQLLSHFNVGVGRTDKILCYTIRDVDSSVSIDLYWDSRQHIISVGIIPGARVQVHRVLLKSSRKNKVYGQAVALSSLNLLRRRSVAIPTDEELTATDSQRRRLIDVFTTNFNSDNAATHFSVRCKVTHVLEVRIWMKCSVCSIRLLEAGSCPNGCSCDSEATVLQAHLKCFIEDGTTEFLLHLDHCDSILSLLGFHTGLARSEVESETRKSFGAELRYSMDPPWYDSDGKQSDGSDSSPLLVRSVGKLSPACEYAVLCRPFSFSRPSAVRRCEDFDTDKFWSPLADITTDELRSRCFRDASGASIATLLHRRQHLQGFWMAAVDVKSESETLLKRLLS